MSNTKLTPGIIVKLNASRPFVDSENLVQTDNFLVITPVTRESKLMVVLYSTSPIDQFLVGKAPSAEIIVSSVGKSHVLSQSSVVNEEFEKARIRASMAILIKAGVMNFSKCIMYRYDQIDYTKEKKSAKLINKKHGAICIGETVFNGKTYLITIPYTSKSRNHYQLDTSKKDLQRYEFPSILLKMEDFPNFLMCDSYLLVDEIVPVEKTILPRIKPAPPIQVPRKYKELLISCFSHMVSENDSDYAKFYKLLSTGMNK